MGNITIKFKDGKTKEFKHEGRAGGSYTKNLDYEGGFAVIEDEYGNKTAYPAESIAEIVETPIRW